MREEKEILCPEELIITTFILIMRMGLNRSKKIKEKITSLDSSIPVIWRGGGRVGKGVIMG